MLPQFIERVWNDTLEDILCSELEDSTLTPAVAGCLFDFLLEKQSVRSEEIAVELVRGEIPAEGSERNKVLYAAVALMRHAKDAGWSFLWPQMLGDEEFAKAVMERVAYEDMHNPSLAFRINEHQTAELYIWQERHYPPASDPVHQGAHTVGPRDAVKEYRDGLLRTLQAHGTPPSAKALDFIHSELAYLDWIPRVIAEAKMTVLRKSWQPMGINELLEASQTSSFCLVRSAGELQDVILESLDRLEGVLQGETPAAPDLWDETNRGIFRPKDENHLSDYVKRHLEQDLQGHGIVSLREVEIRRGEGSGRGERTDIHVTGIAPGLIEGEFDAVRVIVEVKGEWNNELDTAMQSQLVYRYLKDNACQHGIYLVGWYQCQQWDSGDRRSRPHIGSQLIDLKQQLEQQATSLSGNAYAVCAFVMNAAIR